LMPKRCNVLLEAVKELPPLEMLEMKGHGLCHDRTDSASAAAGLCRIVFPRPAPLRLLCSGVNAA